MENFICIDKISKKYTIYKKKSFIKRERIEIEALKDLSFSVKKGEFLGYIGPNGAGKSTTIKILTGILVPEKGNVSVGGLCPWKSRKKYVRNIGVVFGQKTQMWWDLPVKETYKLLKSIYSVSEASYKDQLAFLAEYLSLAELLDKPVRQLSLGQRMRAELGASMIHNPDLLFLDEPTIGLDIISKNRVMEFLRKLNEMGKTIFLTTHDLRDIENLCEEILIIGNGTLAFKGTIGALKQMVKIPTIIKMKIASENRTLQNKQLNFIEKFNGSYKKDLGEIKLKLENGYKPAEVIKKSLEILSIEDLSISEPGIEEVVELLYHKYG